MLLNLGTSDGAANSRERVKRAPQRNAKQRSAAQGVGHDQDRFWDDGATSTDVRLQVPMRGGSANMVTSIFKQGKKWATPWTQTPVPRPLSLSNLSGGNLVALLSDPIANA